MKKILFFIFIWSLAGVCFGSSFEDGHMAYRNGEYQQSINFLTEFVTVFKSETEEEVTKKKEKLAIAYYLLGSSSLKLGRMENGKKWFLAMQEQGVPFLGANFETGQALYATKDFANARTFFLRSLKENYQTAASLLYIAKTYQAEKNYQKSFYFLEKIREIPDDPYGLKQLARYEIANGHFEQIEGVPAKDQRAFVKDIVLPRYYLAYEDSPTSELAHHISEKIEMLKENYELIEEEHQRFIPEFDRKFILMGGQAFGYGHNMAYEKKDNPQGLKTDSFLAKTTLRAKAVMPWTKRVLLLPELLIQKEKITNDENANAYENSSTHFYAYFPFYIFHQGDSPGIWTTIFETEIGQTRLDIDRDFNLETYVNTLGLTLALRKYSLDDALFEFGANVKNFYGFEDSIDRSQYKFYFHKQFRFFSPTEISLITHLTREYFPHNDFSKTLLGFNLRFFVPEFIKKTDLLLSGNLTMISPNFQSESRGNEVLMELLTKGFYHINKTIDFTGEFLIEKYNSSDRLNFAYSNYILFFGVNLSL